MLTPRTYRHFGRRRWHIDDSSCLGRCYLKLSFSFCGVAEKHPLYSLFRQVYSLRNANCRHVSAACKFRGYSIILGVAGTINECGNSVGSTYTLQPSFFQQISVSVDYSLHFLDVETYVNSPDRSHIRSYTVHFIRYIKEVDVCQTLDCFMVPA